MVHDGSSQCQRVGVSHCHCHRIFYSAVQTLTTHQFLGRRLASVSISPEVCNLNMSWPEAWLVFFDLMTDDKCYGLWTAKDYGINELCTMDPMAYDDWLGYDMYGWTVCTGMDRLMLHTCTGNWQSWVYRHRKSASIWSSHSYYIINYQYYILYYIYHTILYQYNI